MQNKIMQTIMFMLAVMLLPTVSIDMTETNEAQTMNETADCALEEGRIMQERTPHNRHAFKRAVRRFSLRFGRRRLKWRIIRSMFGIGKTAPQCPVPPTENETQTCNEVNICPICEDVESDTAPHFSNGLCADCCIDEGFLESNTAPQFAPYSPTAVWDGLLKDKEIQHENRDTAPLSAVIASVSFALIIALIAPKLAFSVPFVGLMARQPKPIKFEQFGKLARKHSKNAIQCKVCAVQIERGAYKVMLPLAGYKQNKPHCYDCAVENTWFKEQGGTPPTPPTPKEEMPRSPPKEVEKVPLKDDIGEEIKQGMKDAKAGDKASQLADLIGQLATGQIDEDEVRRISRRVFSDEFGETNKALAQNVSDAIVGLTSIIEKKAEELKAPLRLELKKNKKVIKIDGIQHHKLPEILFSIVNAGAKNLNLTGEAGTGKTHLIDQIHKALEASGWFKQMGVKGKRECYILSANKDMQAPELIGRESPRFFDDGNGEDAGEWAFIEGAILPNFKNGGIVGLDEMDRFADSTLSALNAGLANGFITTPKGERIMRHPACIIVATGNTKGQGASPKYISANRQDSATLDRFACNFIDIDYDPAIEDAVCGSSELADAVREVRRLADVHGIKGAVFSYRCMIEARKYMEAGCSLEYVMRRMCNAYGDEACIKLGYGDDVPFDATLWGSA